MNKILIMFLIVLGLMITGCNVTTDDECNNNDICEEGELENCSDCIEEPIITIPLETDTSISSESECTSNEDCQSGLCEEGVCALINTNSIPCNDSDNGRNYEEKGTVIFGDYIYTDFCNNGKVEEYYCVNNEPNVEIHNCTNGTICEEGICI